MTFCIVAAGHYNTYLAVHNYYNEARYECIILYCGTVISNLLIKVHYDNCVAWPWSSLITELDGFQYTCWLSVHQPRPQALLSQLIALKLHANVPGDKANLYNHDCQFFPAV